MPILMLFDSELIEQNCRTLLLRVQLLVAIIYTSFAQLTTDGAPQVATNGTGFPTVISTPLGVYNSSKTPPNFPWNTYNYCNAPHVNALTTSNHL